MSKIDDKLQGILYDYSNDMEHLRNQEERGKCRNRYRLAIEALYEPLGKGKLIKILMEEVTKQFNENKIYNAWLDVEKLVEAIINARGER